MHSLYAEFLARASEGRRKSRDEIDRLAQGRVWTGEQALRLGLVDEMGGLSGAIARARFLARIPASRAVGITIFPRAKGLLESLAAMQGARASAGPGGDTASEIRLVERLVQDHVLALMPFRVVPR